MSLTDTQRLIVAAAAEHPDGTAVPPPSLPPAPRAAVAKVLLKAGLLARGNCDGADQSTTWKLDGEAVLLSITDAGRRAIAPTAAIVPTVPLGDSLAASATEAAPQQRQGGRTRWRGLPDSARGMSSAGDDRG